MTMRPIVAGAATVTSAAALVLLDPRWAGSAYAALMVVALFHVQAHAKRKAAGLLLVWTIPFVLPLILIHGVLNSGYPVTSFLLGVVPLRDEGVKFGYDVAVRVAILSTVGAYWLSVDRDEFVEALLRTGLPISLVMVAMQGLVMARLLQYRIDAVYKAQRARGIPVASSFARRLRSLPAVLVPVVVGTFVEAEARVPVLLSQGYGRGEPHPVTARALSLADWLQVLWPPLTLAVVIGGATWA